MPEPHHAEDHREHFPRDGDGDEEEARELAQCVVDKDLTNGAAGGEGKDGVADRGVAPDEGQCVIELVGIGGGEVEEGRKGGGGEVWGEKEVGGCEEGGEEVLGDHHLRARIGAIGSEDMVLGAVGESIEEEVYAKKEETPSRGGCHEGRRGFL